MPKRPATNIATAAEHLAKKSSCLSVIWGIKVFFRRSCEIEAEITSNKPAAVDNAAANAPAATSAITQPDNWAISGLARTIISLSI